MTTDRRLYPEGTKLMVMFDDHDTGTGYNPEKIPKGTILVVAPIGKYKEAYDFVGYKEVGWDLDYIERADKFTRVEIDNWKKLIEG